MRHFSAAVAGLHGGRTRHKTVKTAFSVFWVHLSVNNIPCRMQEYNNFVASEKGMLRSALTEIRCFVVLQAELLAMTGRAGF